MYNKSFKDWRSQGQIVTKLYEHDKNHSEKLILLPVNKFCSFDNESNANIIKILYKDNEDSIIVKKNSGNEIQCPIKYKNIINLIDNLTFTAASKNKIYIYKPLYTKYSIQIIKSLCESYGGSNITL